jgi:hypothetical protein
MFSAQSLELLATERQAELARQAANERLANLVSRRPPRVRSRLAEVLYDLAVRLDPCAVPAAAPSTRPA